MDFMWIGIGSFMLFGCFATINSASSSSFDHDLSLPLLIAGGICIAVGFGFINLDTLKALLP